MPREKRVPPKRVAEQAMIAPPFASEVEEALYWQQMDSSAHIDWSSAKRAQFPNLKYSTQSISLRMPLSMLDELKALANSRDVPYQSMIKMVLAEYLASERVRRARRLG